MPGHSVEMLRKTSTAILGFKIVRFDMTFSDATTCKIAPLSETVPYFQSFLQKVRDVIPEAAVSMPFEPTAI